MLNSLMLSIFQHFQAIPLRSPLISLRSKWRLTGFSRRFTPKNPVRLHKPFGQLPRWGAKDDLPLNLIALLPRIGPWRRAAPKGEDCSASKRHNSSQRHESLCEIIPARRPLEKGRAKGAGWSASKRHNSLQGHESPCEIIVISHPRHLQNTVFRTITHIRYEEIRKLALSSIPAFGRALLQGRTRLTIVAYRRETG